MRTSPGAVSLGGGRGGVHTQINHPHASKGDAEATRGGQGLPEGTWAPCPHPRPPVLSAGSADDTQGTKCVGHGVGRVPAGHMHNTPPAGLSRLGALPAPSSLLPSAPGGARKQLLQWPRRGTTERDTHGPHTHRPPPPQGTWSAGAGEAHRRWEINIFYFDRTGLIFQLGKAASFCPTFYMTFQTHRQVARLAQ